MPLNENSHLIYYHQVFHLTKFCFQRLHSKQLHISQGDYVINRESTNEREELEYPRV